MKIKLFLAAVIMAIAMTACTSDEVVMTPETAETPISFKAATSNMTRALASYDNNHLPGSFEVWAFMCSDQEDEAEGESAEETRPTVKNYFSDSLEEITELMTISGDKVEYSNADGTSGGNWTPKTKRYWPKDHPLYFFAFAGKSDNTSESDNTSVKNFKIGYDSSNKFGVQFDYTVKSTPTEEYTSFVDQQEDLLYAINNGTEGNERKGVGPGTNGSVSLQFKHLLSQICFEAENCNPNSETEFELYWISLDNIHNSGTCTISNILSEDNKPDWKVLESEETTGSRHGILDKDDEGNEQSLDIKLTSSNSKQNISNPNYSKEYSQDEREVFVKRALNLIPQELSNPDKDDSHPYICVSYSYKVDGYTYYPEQKIYLDNVKWEPGKRYIYKLKFKVNEISYDVEVDDFTDYEKPTESESNRDYPDFEL